MSKKKTEEKKEREPKPEKSGDGDGGYDDQDGDDMGNWVNSYLCPLKWYTTVKNLIEYVQHLAHFSFVFYDLNIFVKFTIYKLLECFLFVFSYY